MDILFCITDDLWQPLIVAINSILMNNQKSDIVFHVIHKTITEEHELAIKRFVATKKSCVKFYNVIHEKLVKEFESEDKGVSIEACFRLLAPFVLKNLDRVIYLDADIMVEGNLGDLWEINLEDNILAASESNRADLAYHKAQLRIPCSQPYFYDGMLLMDLEALRKFDLKQMWREFKEEYDTYIRWKDMDFINKMYAPYIKRVGKEIHSMNTECKGHHMSRNRCSAAVIKHYVGPVKPWSEYSDEVYLHDMERYCLYCDVPEITEEFKEKVRENARLYENNIWICTENRDRYDSWDFPADIVKKKIFALKKVREHVLADYLWKRNYTRIAIYGQGEIGGLLAWELLNTDVSVVCFIERKKSFAKYEIPVFQPVQFRDSGMKVDAIVISVLNEYENIKAYLKLLKMTMPIIYVGEIIYEIG